MCIYEEFIPRLRQDTRIIDGRPLSQIEKWFVTCLLDLGIETGIHMTIRQLEAATGISDPVISKAIPRLREAGYIRASKMPGTRESWSLWLGDAPPAPDVVRVEHRLKGARITVIVEEDHGQ